MLRALIVRQAFAALDFILAVAVLVIAFLVITKVYSAGDTVWGESDLAAAGGGQNLSIAEVGGRGEYAEIVDSGLFGPAARSHRDDEPEEPEPEPVEVVDHGLPLALWGTAVPTDTNPFATAIIENSAQRTVTTYHLGQAIMDDIVLAEVQKRRAVLVNEGTNERLILRMDEDDDNGRAPVMQTAQRPTANPPPRPPQNSPNQVTLRRDDMVAELSENYAQVINEVRPALYYDDDGNVAGVTAENLSAAPFTGELQLEDGDVIQTVNGMQIDSEQRMIEIVNRFQDQNVFRVGILRNGEPQMITYRLE